MGFDGIQTKQLTAVIIGITVVVIALGGVVRVYDAGESCPDWPTCFGTWGFDVSEEQQEQWWEENPDEIDSRGSHHRYTSFEIFTEWFHRLVAGTILGPLVLLNWWRCRKEEEVTGEVRFASSIAVILILWQGMIGWLTVKMDNEHWSVALHLGSAILFTISLIWMWLAIVRDRNEEPEWISFDPILSAKWRERIALLGGAVLLTLFTGVFVSTTPGANQACGASGFPDAWPLCQGQMHMEIIDWVAQSQFIHRTLVGVVEAILLVACWAVWKDCEDGQSGKMLCNWIWGISGLYLLNVLLGGLYVLSAKIEGFEIVYIEALSLIHLMIATISFLLLATVWLSINVISLHSNAKHVE